MSRGVAAISVIGIEVDVGRLGSELVTPFGQDSSRIAIESDGLAEVVRVVVVEGEAGFVFLLLEWPRESR
jgi:hypothetical protein